MTPDKFQSNLLRWFDLHGRKDLPWQQPATPYRVWVSEVMLQQTQVVTVIPYFNKFLQQYPTVEKLANAPIDEVLSLWAGLGYYARARNLHKAAGLINKAGYFPNTLETLMDLPGVGQSTAGAISSIAFSKSEPILDGNVRRVLARYKAVKGWTGSSAVNKQLWALSALYTPQERGADYTQAIMDLGATLCTRSKPKCLDCPLNSACQALQNDLVNQLPTPKPRKKIPVKQSIFAILINKDNEIFLEKRASIGIWGGLWSVPEFDNEGAIEQWCTLKSIQISKKQTLEKRRHTFSHYHLDYVPILLYVDNLINNVMEADKALWYKHRQMMNIALPAPVTQLFDELNED